MMAWNSFLKRRSHYHLNRIITSIYHHRELILWSRNSFSGTISTELAIHNTSLFSKLPMIATGSTVIHADEYGCLYCAVNIQAWIYWLQFINKLSNLDLTKRVFHTCRVLSESCSLFILVHCESHLQQRRN